MKKKIQRPVSSLPDEQECRIIILNMISQAVKDYESFKAKTGEDEKEIFDTANQFLFNDKYMIDWGGEDFNLAKFCDYLNIDIEWIRNQVVKKLDLNWKPVEGILIPSQEF